MYVGLLDFCTFDAAECVGWYSGVFELRCGSGTDGSVCVCGVGVECCRIGTDVGVCLCGVGVGVGVDCCGSGGGGGINGWDAVGGVGWFEIVRGAGNGGFSSGGTLWLVIAVVRWVDGGDCVDDSVDGNASSYICSEKWNNNFFLVC